MMEQLDVYHDIIQGIFARIRQLEHTTAAAV